MGQDLSITAQTAPSIAVSSYVDIIKDIHYVSQLNSSRFLKTCKALDPHGEIILKIFLKTDAFTLIETINRVSAESHKLNNLPNVLHYNFVFETERAGYLIRQHLHSNLYNRLCSRPFFKSIELRFICFQLLHILKDIHAIGCCHGDIKPENLLITSGNWLILTDFSDNIKPVYIPEDNPNEYSFYFNTSQRGACYLAPERFDNSEVEKRSKSQAKLSTEMDVFSAGCCIFEIFKEASKPLFTFSEMFKFKHNEINLRSILEKEFGKDTDVCDLIMDMVDLYSERRLSADALLKKYANTIFPDYFYSTTYPSVKDLVLGELSATDENQIKEPACANKQTVDTYYMQKRSSIDQTFQNFYHNLETMCTGLHYQLNVVTLSKCISFGEGFVKLHSSNVVKLEKYNVIKDRASSIAAQSALPVISVLTRFLRILKFTESQIHCMDSLMVLSQYIEDKSKIDNVLPYFVMMLFSKNTDVQIVAMQKVIQLLCLLSEIDSENENLLIDYVLPKFKMLLQSMKHNNYGRIMFAQCMSALTQVVLNFQDILIDNAVRKYDNDVDDSILNLNHKILKSFEYLAVSLLTDDDSNVRIAFLQNIVPVCTLFGKDRSNDIILSHLITYLNDKNSLLRAQFIETISNIAIVLGPISFEQYILPLMIQALSDPDESVAMIALKTLYNTIRIGLLKPRYFTDTCSIIAPLVLHPNESIRQFSLSIIICILSGLRTSEKYCIMYPIIKPYFELDLELTPSTIIFGVKSSISRKLFNIFYSWCLNASNSLFWKKQPNNKSIDLFGASNVEFVTKDYLTKTYGFHGSQLSKDMLLSNNSLLTDVPLSIEDKNWMEKLKRAGLKDEHKWKLALLRVYTFRMAKMSPRKAVTGMPNGGSLLVENLLSQTKALPRNVFFRINILPEYKQEKLFIVSKPTNIIMTEKKERKVSVLTEEEEHQESVPPKAFAVNGSLILPNTSKPTSNSNFENVYVQLESSSSLLYSNSNKTALKKANRTKFTVSNTYEGDSAEIKKFLSTIEINPPFESLKEFGIFSDSSSEQKGLRAMELHGSFVTCVSENNNEENTNTTAVACSPSISFMITGTDTGMLKIWNVQQLKENKVFSNLFEVNVKSYITDIEFLKGFHAFLVATKNGRVALYSFASNEDSSGLLNVKLVSVFEYQKPNEHGLKIITMKSPNCSNFFVLSNKGTILQFDARTMDAVHEISHQKKSGAVISFTVSSDMSWLLLGTVSGIIALWDIRLNCLIKSWTFGDQSPIHELYTYPSLNQKIGDPERLVLVVGGSSSCIASLWDLRKILCKRVIRKNTADNLINLDDFISRDQNLEAVPFAIGNIQLSSVVMEVVNDTILIWDSNKKDIVLLSFLNETSGSRVLIGSDKTLGGYTTSKLSANLSVSERGNAPTSDKAVSKSFMSDNIQYLKMFCSSNGAPLLTVISTKGRFDIYE